MKLIDSLIDRNDWLSYSLKDIFIAFFHEDISPVGKDNRDSDYVIISEIPDLYIRNCIVQVLDSKYGSVFSQNPFNGKYLIKCKIRYDLLITPRSPQSAYYFDSEAENYFRLWLLERISKFYNIDDHLATDELNSNYYVSIDDFEFSSFSADQNGSYCTITGVVINKDKELMEPIKYEVKLVNSTADRDHIFEDKCRKIILYNHIEQLDHDKFI